MTRRDFFTGIIAAFPTCRTTTRTYHKIRAVDLATTTHTHVEVSGVVKSIKCEDDGDVHMIVLGFDADIVCEIIPKLPVHVPRVGQHVRVRGISRYDKTHKWPEIHPVEEIR